nr:MAG TPA: hypothetical protein [Bacteriophage sp.]
MSNFCSINYNFYIYCYRTSSLGIKIILYIILLTEKILRFSLSMLP